jgi:hypothetical protein
VSPLGEPRELLRSLGVERDVQPMGFGAHTSIVHGSARPV